MKSLMKSYNAGNVAFYENLHKKYFDKAKCAKNTPPDGEDLPQELLDMTDDNMVSKVTHELSRLMVESRMNEGSRSRSRSRGGNSNFMGASKFKN